MKIKNIVDRKGKVITGFVGMAVCAIVLSVWPPKEPAAQVPQPTPAAAPILPQVKVVDSLARENDRKDSFNIYLARDVMQLAKAKMRKDRREHVPESLKKELSELPGIAAIRTKDSVYQVRVEYYAGIPVIDGNDIYEAFGQQSQVSVRAAAAGADRRNVLQQVGDFLSAPFKRKKHD